MLANGAAGTMATVRRSQHRSARLPLPLQFPIPIGSPVAERQRCRRLFGEPPSLLRDGLHSCVVPVMCQHWGAVLTRRHADKSRMEGCA